MRLVKLSSPKVKPKPAKLRKKLAKKKNLERARNAYRKKHGVELSNCLKSLEFVDDLAVSEVVLCPNGKVTSLPIMNIPTAAKAMQKLYQTVWRWVQKDQIPEPVLQVYGKKEMVFHVNEVRIFIEEIGQHEKTVVYYRRDHEKVRDRIFTRISNFRKKMKWRN